MYDKYEHPQTKTLAWSLGRLEGLCEALRLTYTQCKDMTDKGYQKLKTILDTLNGSYMPYPSDRNNALLITNHEGNFVAIISARNDQYYYGFNNTGGGNHDWSIHEVASNLYSSVERLNKPEYRHKPIKILPLYQFKIDEPTTTPKGE